MAITRPSLRQGSHHVLQAKVLWTASHVDNVHLPKRLRLALGLKLAQTLGRKISKYQLKPRIGPLPDNDLLQGQVPPLLLSCILGHVGQVQRLLNLAVATNGSLKVSEVVNTQSSTGETPLSVACSAGHHDVVRLLLAHGADPYIYDNLEVSPLMKAAHEGHTSIVKTLLEEGSADCHHMSPSGRTALLEACHHGHVRVVKILLEHDADVKQACEETGNHALMEAAAAGQLDVVKLLLGKGGAKVNQTDKQGNTALLVTARMGDMGLVRYLLHMKAKNIASFTDKRTPLMEAACNGYLPVVQLLLQHVTLEDLKARDAHGRTALDLSGRPVVAKVIQTTLDILESQAEVTKSATQ